MMNKKRNGMQDIINQCVRQFPVTEKFDEAYPGIKDISIQYSEEGRIGGYYSCQEYVVEDKRSIGSYIRCGNDICSRGGFEIGSVIQKMIKDKECEYCGMLRCIGFEVYSRRPKHEKPCSNICKLKIIITYVH